MNPEKLQTQTDNLIQAIANTADLLQLAEEFDKHYGLGRYRNQPRKMTRADYIELQQGTIVNHDT